MAYEGSYNPSESALNWNVAWEIVGDRKYNLGSDLCDMVVVNAKASCLTVIEKQEISCVRLSPGSNLFATIKIRLSHSTLESTNCSIDIH